MHKSAEIKTTLLPHQQRALQRAMKGNLLLAHSVGAGKTLTSIAIADKLGRPTVVITPASLVENYKKELTKHLRKGTGTRFTVLSLPKDSYRGYAGDKEPTGWNGTPQDWQDMLLSRWAKMPLPVAKLRGAEIDAYLDLRRQINNTIWTPGIGSVNRSNMAERLFKVPPLQQQQPQQEQPVQQPQQEQQPRQAMLEKAPRYIGNKIGQVGAKIDKFPAYIGNKINSAADQIQRRFNGTPAPNPVRRKPQTVGANSTMLPGIGPGYRNKLVNQFFNPAKMQNQQKPQGPGNSSLGFKR